MDCFYILDTFGVFSINITLCKPPENFLFFLTLSYMDMIAKQQLPKDVYVLIFGTC